MSKKNILSTVFIAGLFLLINVQLEARSFAGKFGLSTSIANIPLVLAPTPTCAINVTVNSTTICSGASAVLTANGATTYTWSPALGLSAVSGSTVTANPSVTTTYTVIGTNGCGVDTALAIVTVNLPDGKISSSGIGCEDVQVWFTGINGTPPYTFTYQLEGVTQGLIQSSDTSSTLLYDRQQVDVGVYTYSLIKIKDAFNCSSTIAGQTTVISVYSKPNAVFSVTPEQTSLLSPIVSIENLSVGYTSALWKFGDGKQLNTDNPKNHTYADTGSYKMSLVLSNQHGCQDSMYQMVYIQAPFVLYVPNAFSPNEDGVNDVFMPNGEMFAKYELTIFDKWGNSIFHSNDINKGWDGKANGGAKIAQKDTYVYVIDVKPLSNKHDYTYRGYLNLID